MLIRLWIWLTDTLKVKFGIYKNTILWLLFFMLCGIVFAIISIIIGDIGVDEINHSLVDQNIINCASSNAGISGFLIKRIMSIVLPMLLIFVFAIISKFTALIIFPFFLMHGYWFCMSIWWTICFYTVNSIFLLSFYIFWLLVITAVLIACCLWIQKVAEPIRCVGFRLGCKPKEIWKGIGIILLVAVVLGFIEYLMYAMVLGRIVYKPV